MTIPKDTIKQLENLKLRHREVDKKIEALKGELSSDQLQIQRLKKQKLKLKDQISIIEANLLPDIIA